MRMVPLEPQSRRAAKPRSREAAAPAHADILFVADLFFRAWSQPHAWASRGGSLLPRGQPHTRLLEGGVARNADSSAGDLWARVARGSRRAAEAQSRKGGCWIRGYGRPAGGASGAPESQAGRLEVGGHLSGVGRMTAFGSRGDRGREPGRARSGATRSRSGGRMTAFGSRSEPAREPKRSRSGAAASALGSHAIALGRQDDRVREPKRSRSGARGERAREPHAIAIRGGRDRPRLGSRSDPAREPRRARSGATRSRSGGRMTPVGSRREPAREPGRARSGATRSAGIGRAG